MGPDLLDSITLHLRAFSIPTISCSLEFAPPQIENVIFCDPATIVFWEDGTKTVVKCQKDKGDTYSKETGIAMAILKKIYGNGGKFNDIINKWIEK